ncbi:MAG: NUDIX domain-containing protein [Verrucomicrobia bacterium]|nr:NUDIX domain-containing protein [Verrucomicrobiota bacterium]
MNQPFKFCPGCGENTLLFEENKLLRCSDCGFHFYRNPTAAVAGIIEAADGRVLLIRRAKDPSRGKLAFPGGFVDIDETVESALRREIAEEVGLQLTEFTYLTSHPNDYRFKNIVYPVIDMFFVCHADGSPASAQPDEVESVQWISPNGVDKERLAFESMKHAWLCFQKLAVQLSLQGG